MSFVIFALQLLVWPAVIFALLLLSAAVAAALVQAALMVGSLGDSARLRRVYRFASRGFSPAMYLLVGTAALLLMLAAVLGESRLYNAAYIIAVVGVVMGTLNWLDKVFAKPMTKVEFDRAMAEQAQLIEAGNARVVAAVQEGNAQVVGALQKGNAQLATVFAEMTQQMSELSGDIRSLLEVRSEGAGSPAPSGDADGSSRPAAGGSS